MRYLADTHLVYWWMTADKKLGKAMQRLIANNDIVVSAASVWEMILKNEAGKLPLPAGPVTDELEAQGFILLPILPRHLEEARAIGIAHADPFDRLLIAQARGEQLTLITRDAAILDLRLKGVLEA